MNDTPRPWQAETRKILPLVLTSACVFIIGAAKGYISKGSELPNYLCIAALSILACYDAGKNVQRDSMPMPETATRTVMAAWTLLAAGCIIMLFPHVSSVPAARAAALLCIAMATLLRFYGPRLTVRHLAPYACCLLILPFFAHISLYIGYPLRRMATVITAEIWRLFDSRLMYLQTIIRIEGLDVAITDACSGIEQLEAMLLLAYLVVRNTRCSLIYRILHYSSIFTIIVLANAFRLLVTIALFYLFGSRVLEPTPHMILGWMQVITAILIFILAGKIIPEGKSPDQQASVRGKTEETA